MNSSSRLYTQEIIDFLHSLVIKFTPFESILNNNIAYLTVPGFIENDITTFPYYRILSGDAAFSTEPLYGYVPSLRSEVLLNRENLQLYPDMLSFYREQSNLKLLLQRYPNDDFLIRRILNPVKDIQAAFSAKNLTILETEFEDTFLNEYERSSLIIFLQENLWYIDYRWYINPLEYEDLYPHAFWAMLWNLLPVLLLTKRILNIKTLDVHPWHIWEYLTSLGFGGYRGYLSHSQELFLYRNALYLKFHAGKKFLLDILERVFLYPLRYSLNKKTIIAHTLGREEYHDKVPDIVPSKGSIDEHFSSTNFDAFLQDIYAEGHDVRNDITYRNDINDLFSKAPTNKLNTKFLEFDRNIDESELMLLLRFILDSTIYHSTQDQLQFGVEIQSPISQNILRFNNSIDALNLLFYIIYRKDSPINVFTKYTLTTAIAHTTPPVIDKYGWVEESKYYIKSYVDLPNIVPQIPYIGEPVFSAKDFSYKLGDLYVWLFGMINKLRTLSSSEEHELHHKVFRTLVPEIQVVDIQQQYTTFTEYFDQYPYIYEELQKITDEEQYGEFMHAIITGICPLEYGFAALARDDKVVSILIHKIKELFMYMVSYNINFINKTFDQTTIVEIPKITMHLDVGVAGPGSIPGDDHTTHIGWLMFLQDDILNTLDYRVSIQQTTEIPLESEVQIDMDLTHTETSYDLHFNHHLEDVVPPEQITTNIIYASTKGVELTFLNTI